MGGEAAGGNGGRDKKGRKANQLGFKGSPEIGPARRDTTVAPPTTTGGADSTGGGTPGRPTTGQVTVKDTSGISVNPVGTAVSTLFGALTKTNPVTAAASFLLGQAAGAGARALGVEDESFLGSTADPPTNVPVSERAPVATRPTSEAFDATGQFTIPRPSPRSGAPSGVGGEGGDGRATPRVARTPTPTTAPPSAVATTPIIVSAALLQRQRNERARARARRATSFENILGV